MIDINLRNSAYESLAPATKEWVQAQTPIELLNDIDILRYMDRGRKELSLALRDPFSIYCGASLTSGARLPSLEELQAQDTDQPVVNIYDSDELKAVVAGVQICPDGRYRQISYFGITGAMVRAVRLSIPKHLGNGKASAWNASVKLIRSTAETGGHLIYKFGHSNKKVTEVKVKSIDKPKISVPSAGIAEAHIEIIQNLLLVAEQTEAMKPLVARWRTVLGKTFPTILEA